MQGATNRTVVDCSWNEVLNATSCLVECSPEGL